MNPVRPAITKESPLLNNCAKKLNAGEASLISNINLIFEMILTNSLKYNKLTSSQEILERISGVANDVSSEGQLSDEADEATVRAILESLSGEKGVLVRLKKK